MPDRQGCPRAPTARERLRDRPSAPTCIPLFPGLQARTPAKARRPPRTHAPVCPSRPRHRPTRQGIAVARTTTNDPTNEERTVDRGLIAAALGRGLAPPAAPNLATMTEDRIAILAERHRRVLRLYAQRYRLKEIARELSLSENSVNTYLTEAVQILQVGGRRAAADALERHEGPSRFSRYPVSVPDSPPDAGADEGSQTEGEPRDYGPPRLPLRPKSGVPNRLPVHVRLLWMLALLIVLISGVAVAVAVYTVDVKPMEHLIRARASSGKPISQEESL